MKALKIISIAILLSVFFISGCALPIKRNSRILYDCETRYEGTVCEIVGSFILRKIYSQEECENSTGKTCGEICQTKVNGICKTYIWLPYDD